MIYLRADEEVPFGTIARVMDRARQAGVKNINVVTQPEKLAAPLPGLVRLARTGTPVPPCFSAHRLHRT